MNNLVASVFDPPEALFHRTLHFALHCIGFISHNSLFPLQFRVRIEIPSVWRRSSALITFLVSYILKIAVATIIKIWGRRRRRIISSTSAVTSQVIHVGWLYPTLVAWFRSWSFLHIRRYFLHSERERGVPLICYWVVVFIEILRNGGVLELTGLGDSLTSICIVHLRTLLLKVIFFIFTFLLYLSTLCSFPYNSRFILSQSFSTTMKTRFKKKFVETWENKERILLNKINNFQLSKFDLLLLAALISLNTIC